MGFFPIRNRLIISSETSSYLYIECGWVTVIERWTFLLRYDRIFNGYKKFPKIIAIAEIGYAMLCALCENIIIFWINHRRWRFCTESIFIPPNRRKWLLFIGIFAWYLFKLQLKLMTNDIFHFNVKQHMKHSTLSLQWVLVHCERTPLRLNCI